MNISSFLRTTQISLTLHRNLNCWTAGITKKHRKLYLRDYLTYLVLPHGGSIRIQYDTPRRIIRLPLDLETLTEEQRKQRIEDRKTYTKAKIVEEYQDEFDESQFFNPSKGRK